MTPEEQLDLWIEGKSVHNKERDECCPDFSCCEPSLLAPKEARIAFKKANEETRMGMLGVFLSGAVSKAAEEARVYIAGEGTEQ